MASAAIYTRVSTRQQSEDGTSLTSQEEACRKLATEKGYTVSAVYREDYPGDTLDRPQLNRLRETIRQGKVQALIVYAMDRLSREPVELLLLIQECDKAGVEVLFVTESHDKSIEGELITLMRGYFGKLERLKIRERTMRGKASRAREGKLPQGTGAGIYGYDYADGKRTINEEQARWVMMMFQRCAEGLSCYSIAAELIAKGVPTLSGKPWNPRTITNMLRSHAYKGVTYTNIRKRIPKGGRRYSLTIRDKSEWIEIPGATPPIVTAELWAAAEKRLNTPHYHPANPNRRVFLLVGYVRCVCGGAMTSHSLTVRGVKYHYYRCTNSITDKTKTRTCKSRELRAEWVETDVWGRISRLLKDPELILEALGSEQTEDVDAAREITRLEKRIAALDGEQVRLVRLYRFGEIDDAYIQEEAGKLKKQKQAAQQELEALLDRQRHLVNLAGETDLAIAYCQQFGEAVDRFTFDDKRLALQALDVRVTVDLEKNWTVRGSIPLLPKPKDLATKSRTSA